MLETIQCSIILQGMAQACDLLHFNNVMINVAFLVTGETSMIFQ